MDTDPQPSNYSKTSPVGEVRYSLKEMMQEVEEERRNSSLGRELVDSNEIGKLFTFRKKKKKE